MSFSRLKKMSLCGVEISQEEDFSGCPVLEILELKNSRFMPQNDCSISSPQLKDLSIELISPPSGNFHISAPQLISLKIRSIKPVHVSLGNSCSIDKVDIEWFTSLKNYTTSAKELMGILRGFQTAKDVTLAIGILEVLSTVPKLELEPSPFCKLKHLRLRRRYGQTDINLSYKAISYLLKSSPNFQTITVELHKK